MEDTQTPAADHAFYCTECFKGNLPIGLTCSRLPRGEFKATCLRCCGHNHG